MLRIVAFTLLIIFFQVNQGKLFGQTACTTLGQNPYSAFPVCGSTNFTQLNVPVCGGKKLPSFCTDGSPYVDLNPYWYKFTCYTAGSLGLLITPKTLSDDYDWQMFDITGRDPLDVYKDSSMVVCYNWSGNPGATGTAQTAAGLFHCFGTAAPNFSISPDLKQGHEYLLMISHFSGSDQSGYSLSFPTSGPNAGTASIINPVTPAIVGASGICDGSQVLVKLNRRINCNTIAADGSDFILNNGRMPVKASGYGCSTGFDSDSVLLTLNQVLSPGSYTVTAKTGTDGNTLSDNCGIALPAGANANMIFTPAAPAQIDSVVPGDCITNEIRLYFSKPIVCSSIIQFSSNFYIRGPNMFPSPSSVGAYCVNGVASEIIIKLASSIRENGTYSVELTNNNGKALIDECGFTLPAAGPIFFTAKNIVTADIQSNVTAGCKADTLTMLHNGNNGANSWEWKVDGTIHATQQTPAAFISKISGNHLLQLKTGNGFCTDTASRIINFPDNSVKAGFTVNDTLCPPDLLTFINTSSANASSWKWDFGNGTTSTDKDPVPQAYTTPNRTTQLKTSLTVQNSFNCTDIAYKTVTLMSSCTIAVPSAFTPNGDGLNDYLYPLNNNSASNVLFRVYNRFGQVVFETKDANKKWDGRYQSILQPPGTYVWTLDYTDSKGEKISLKGTTVLIR